MRGVLEAFVDRVVRPLIRYRTIYRARVVVHRSDELLEVEVLDRDDRGKPLVEVGPVPLRGLAGVVAHLKPGAIVLVGFETGDPTRPIATLAEASGLESIKVTADVEVHLDCPRVRLSKSAGRGVGRVGDIMSITGTAVPGGPFTATATIMTGSEEALA